MSPPLLLCTSQGKNFGKLLWPDYGKFILFDAASNDLVKWEDKLILSDHPEAASDLAQRFGLLHLVDKTQRELHSLRGLSASTHRSDGDDQGVIQLFPQECISERIIEQVVDIPVPQIQESRTVKFTPQEQFSNSTWCRLSTILSTASLLNLVRRSLGRWCAESAWKIRAESSSNGSSRPPSHKSSTLRAHQMAVPGQRRTNSPRWELIKWLFPVSDAQRVTPNLLVDKVGRCALKL